MSKSHPCQDGKCYIRTSGSVFSPERSQLCKFFSGDPRGSIWIMSQETSFVGLAALKSINAAHMPKQCIIGKTITCS